MPCCSELPACFWLAPLSAGVFWILWQSPKTRAHSALGGFFGLLLGISLSPILGVAITAAFAVVGTILGKKTAGPNEAAQDTAIAAAPSGGAAVSARPVDATQYDRIVWPPSEVQLFHFAISLFFGLFLGIILRVNDSLNFTSTDRLFRLQKLGFSKAQAMQIVAHEARVLAGEPLNLPRQYDAMGFTDKQIAAIMERHSLSIAIDPTPKATSLSPNATSDATKPPEATLSSKTGAMAGRGIGWFVTLTGNLSQLQSPPRDDKEELAIDFYQQEVDSLHALIADTVKSHRDPLLSDLESYFSALMAGDKKPPTLPERFKAAEEKMKQIKSTWFPNKQH